MYKFILTEDDKSYIKGLYNINEESDSFTLKQVQELLLQRGLDLGKTGVDGNYGPKTAAALVNALTSQTKISPMKPKEAKPIQTQTTQSTPQLQKQDEVEINKKDKENENKKPQEIQNEASRLANIIKSASQEKKDARKPCIDLVGNARTLRRKGITFQNSTMDKEILSYCLNTYKKVGEDKLRNWAGI